MPLGPIVLPIASQSFGAKPLVFRVFFAFLFLFLEHALYMMFAPNRYN